MSPKWIDKKYGVSVLTFMGGIKASVSYESGGYEIRVMDLKLISKYNSKDTAKLEAEGYLKKILNNALKSLEEV